MTSSRSNSRAATLAQVAPDRSGTPLAHCAMNRALSCQNKSKNEMVMEGQTTAGRFYACKLLQPYMYIKTVTDVCLKSKLYSNDVSVSSPHGYFECPENARCTCLQVTSTRHHICSLPAFMRGSRHNCDVLHSYTMSPCHCFTPFDIGKTNAN